MDVPQQIKSFALVAAATFVALSGLCFAGEDWQPLPIGPFGTLNTRDNSYAIPADKAQDLLNVELTPGGKSVRKRKGYGLAYSTTITTSPVHGVYSFYDAGGNTVDLVANDTYLTASLNGGTPSVLFSTGPLAATYQCADSLGFAYCANTSRSALTKTNGSTYSTITGVSSVGTMVAACPTRLAMAGFSDRPSGIDFSADTDFTTWGTGSLGSSAAQFTINAPGPRITLIAYAFNRLMWFKNTSFGYILIGNQPAQSDWVVKTISSDVGTNDNSYVYREGIFYFRGSDGHVYAFDGSNYQRLTREVSGTVDLSQNRTANTWTQTTQADWQSGSLTNLDATTNPGDVALARSSEALQNSYYPGNSAVNDVFNNGTGRQFATGTSNYLLTAITIPVQLQGSPPPLVMTIRSTSGNSPGTVLGTVNVASTSFLTGDLKISFSSPIALQSGTTYWIYGTGAYTNGTNNLLWWEANADDPGFAGYINGIGNGQARRLQYKTFGSTYSATGTLLSAVKNAPNLTAWDAFSSNGQTNGGTQTFSIRASTLSFPVTASTPSWTTILSGNIPSIATGTYFQIRDAFTTPTSTNTPVLNDLTVNWFEGAASDKSYATYFDDKIIWSITYGNGASTNNRLLVYDVLNQGWLFHDIAANGFFVRRNKLYFGSALFGKLYKYGDTDNDAGAAINSYWKSKDFFGGNPFASQELANISLVTKSVVNSTMTVTYTRDGQTASSYNINSYNSSASFVDKNTNLPQGMVCSSFNVKVGNNAVDQPWEVFGIQVGIRPRSWIPTP